MKALSVINTMPQTKAEIKEFALNVKNEILSGEYNPLDVDVQLKAMEETIKAIRADKEIKEYVLEEAQRHGEKSFELPNAKIQVKDATRYDYSNDTTWSELKAIETNAANTRKGREVILKGVDQNEGGVDMTTGEKITAPIRTGSTIISITLK